MYKKDDVVVCIDPPSQQFSIYAAYSIKEVVGDLLRMNVDETNVYDSRRFFLPNFKKGDRIVCIQASYPLQYGATYIFDRQGANEIYVENVSHSFFSFRFVNEDIFHKKSKIQCPDCKGSGVYQGFMVIETCKLCKGDKVVLA